MSDRKRTIEVEPHVFDVIAEAAQASGKTPGDVVAERFVSAVGRPAPAALTPEERRAKWPPGKLPAWVGSWTEPRGSSLDNEWIDYDLAVEAQYGEAASAYRHLCPPGGADADRE